MDVFTHMEGDRMWGFDTIPIVMKNKIRVAFCVMLVAGAALMSFSADYAARDFGAKGGGKTKDTAALQSAIDTCSAKGGGRVVLSDGVFLSGAVEFKSGVGATGTLVIRSM